jgi:hypothetical protein
MDVVSIAIAGFSAVISVLLLLTYVGFLEIPNKSIYSILSCAVLLTVLPTLQVGHLLYFLGGEEPLSADYYRVALFVAPASFYFFGRGQP